MKSILLALPLVAGIFTTQAPAENDTTCSSSFAAIGDDLRGTADGQVRPDGRGLRGTLRNEDGSVLGSIIARLNPDGSLIAVSSTPSGRLVLSGAWDSSGFVAGFEASGISIEIEGELDGSSWSAEWRVELP